MKPRQPKALPEPVDVHEGIPDRSASPSRRRLLLVVGLFALWLGVLLAVLLLGRAGR